MRIFSQKCQWQLKRGEDWEIRNQLKKNDTGIRHHFFVVSLNSKSYLNVLFLLVWRQHVS
ncbi:MAG: hypothetical protein ACD_2C00088G0025 [uncultured bacterium (gcode 4)]|uniref:Uncharacterized protein n=1 Tax=uncultured bacterium (gcode 4) TaxID=1234023 RepID=K2H1Y8_9BACT|nr:MAG: hypothetical protein ACD_2C00088G0025 [uncultured bacterium (gcode 4)]